MTTKRATKTTTLNDLFDLMKKEHKRYIDSDSLPVSLFLVSFFQFYNQARLERQPRFIDALRWFDLFASRSAELEEDQDAFGMWRYFENGLNAVELYDRAFSARSDAPKLSIEELLALGVSRQQIALIYGFKKSDGTPDIDAVENRQAWAIPKERANGVPSPFDGAETATIARLAVDALQKIESSADCPAVDSETIARLSAIVPKAETSDERAKIDDGASDERAKIAREIMDGVPVRQISARYGITADDVKALADELKVKALDNADELPPRLVQSIEKYRDDVLNGSITFRTVAKAVSTVERRVSEGDVKRVLSAFQTK